MGRNGCVYCGINASLANAIFCASQILNMFNILLGVIFHHIPLRFRADLPVSTWLEAQ